jgi:photosystem II stability/assembly factor-like uncharacterized protein
MKVFRLLLPAFLLLCVPLTTFAQSTSVWDNVPANIKARNSFKRVEAFYRQRAVPFDTVPVYRFNTERLKEIAKERLQNPLSSLVNWTALGPRGILSTWPPQWGECSGRVRAVAVHPANPDIVYIGAASGGLWKTTNGGTSWSDVSQDFATSAFGAIAIDPSNPNVVYAGTGEAVDGFNMNFYDGRGLFKSTNAGATWTQVTNGFGLTTHFGAIAVCPTNPNIVLACLASGYSLIGSLSNEGIWRSTDAGVTWTRVVNVGNAFDIVFHPTIPFRVFAAAGGGGVYLSDDFGATWLLSNAGIPVQTGRIQIAIAPSAPEIMYAFGYFSGSQTRAYKSTNGGSNWLQISTGVQLGGTYDGTSWVDQGWYDACIAVDPVNPNHVLLGNCELHQTTNGQDFVPVRNPAGPFGGTRAWDSPMHTDYHRIVYAPSNSNIIYVGCDGGLFRSTDGGATWVSRNSGISSAQFYRISSHPTNRNSVFGGAQDNGNFLSTNSGASAWVLATTGDGMECVFDHLDALTPITMYASTQNGNLLRSDNEGAYGTFFGISPPYESTPNWTMPIILHPSNPGWIYVGSRKLWRSTDYGSSWESISASATSDAINTIAQNSVNPDVIVMAGSGYSNANPPILVSTDGGFNWRDVTSNIPGAARYVSRVVSHPYDPNTMFVVRSGFGSGKLYRSNNLGSSWTNISGDLPDIPCNDLFVDPLHPSHYYIATDLGVYLSTDAGGSWVRQGTGMPFVPAIDFDYFASGGTRLLRIGTHGRGAFEAPLTQDVTPLISVSPLSKDFAKLEVLTGRDTTTVTVRNLGQSQLTITAISRNQPIYQLIDLPPLPANIASMSSLAFKVVFAPIVHGVVVDTIVIASTDPGNPSTRIPLTGKGVEIGRARAGIMYAVSAGQPTGHLFTINTTTGVATIVAPLGVPEIDALTVRPTTNELYGIFTSATASVLYRVSPLYGDALSQRSIPLPNLRAIAFSRGDTLYGGTTSGRLYRISLASGDTTYIGTAPTLAYSAFSFSPSTGVLWASVRPPLVNRDKIYTVNTTTGAATLVGGIGDNAITPSITFGPTGVLYALKGVGTQTNTLLQVDSLTGVGTLIGSTGVQGLLAIAMRADSLVTGVVEDGKTGVPTSYALHQNYPNPFNPTTQIAYDLPVAGHVRLALFDVVGKEIAILVDEMEQPGYKTVVFDSSRFASGVYFYRLAAGTYAATRKMMVLK